MQAFEFCWIYPLGTYSPPLAGGVRGGVENNNIRISKLLLELLAYRQAGRLGQSQPL